VNACFEPSLMLGLFIIVDYSSRPRTSAPWVDYPTSTIASLSLSLSLTLSLSHTLSHSHTLPLSQFAHDWSRESSGHLSTGNSEQLVTSYFYGFLTQLQFVKYNYIVIYIYIYFFFFFFFFFFSLCTLP
jgi:hypothetical protein